MLSNISLSTTKRPIHLLLLFVAYLVLSIITHKTSFAIAATIRRVPSQYSTPADAISAAQNGDTIEIDAGTYTGSSIVATVLANDLTIRGVGGRAHMNASGVTISNKKAIWLTKGNNIIIEDIEFSHAIVPDKNGAGIKHEGGLLTIRNCYFHDNENGLLSSSSASAADLLVEYSEFNHNGLGSPGYTHNIYIGNIEKFTLRYSYSHHAVHGHNVKTRANENHILYNRIMDEDSGNASYQIDVPNGGLTYIIGNTIHKGKNAENTSLMSYAVEGAINPLQKLFISGNTLVNDRSSSIGIRISGTPESIIVNNIFDGIDIVFKGNAIKVENNLHNIDNHFVDRIIYDFHLTKSSPAINAGKYIYEAGSFNLTPENEYMHPLGMKERISDGSMDIGAFEYEIPQDQPMPLTPPANLRIMID